MWSLAILSVIYALAMAPVMGNPLPRSESGVEIFGQPAEILSKRDEGLGVSAFGECLKKQQPEWPRIQATKEQTVACRPAYLQYGKRQSSVLSVHNMIFTTACNMGARVNYYLKNDDVAKNVEHNQVKDDTPTDLVAKQICPAAVELLIGAVTKDPSQIGVAWTSFKNVTGQDRSGPKSSGIVSYNKPLTAITSALITFDPSAPTGALKGLALKQVKQLLIDGCAETWVQAATSCTEDIKYGFLAGATQKAINGMSGYIHGPGNILAQFDIGTAMRSEVWEGMPRI